MNEPTETAVSPEASTGADPKGRIGLIILVLYVAILALGTVGELFDIEWILDLPLFRPPGKY